MPSTWSTGAGSRLVVGTCPIERPEWISGPPQWQYRVMFARSGAFLQRVNGVEAVVDSTSLSIVHPGDEMEVAHPYGCGDTFALAVLTEQEAESRRLPRGEFTLTDEIDLAYRTLIGRARRGADELELAERMGAILDRLPGQPERNRPALRAAHRRLAAEATELLVVEGFGLGVDGIAGRLHCSPHHLSRTFRRVMGQTMTEYRNRSRVRQVLSDIEAGERRLRDLAARYGFADQAHMIRVVRRHAGDSPGTLKKLFGHESTTPR